MITKEGQEAIKKALSDLKKGIEPEAVEISPKQKRLADYHSGVWNGSKYGADLEKKFKHLEQERKFTHD